MGKNLLRQLGGSGQPLLTTFYIPALAAAKYGYPKVVCVVTDSDIEFGCRENPKGAKSFTASLWLESCGLGDGSEDTARVIWAANEYFEAFNRLLLETDILWTKP